MPLILTSMFGLLEKDSNCTWHDVIRATPTPGRKPRLCEKHFNFPLALLLMSFSENSSQNWVEVINTSDKLINVPITGFAPCLFCFLILLLHFKWSRIFKLTTLTVGPCSTASESHKWHTLSSDSILDYSYPQMPLHHVTTFFSVCKSHLKNPNQTFGHAKCNV